MRYSGSLSSRSACSWNGEARIPMLHDTLSIAFFAELNSQCLDFASCTLERPHFGIVMTLYSIYEYLMCFQHLS